MDKKLLQRLTLITLAVSLGLFCIFAFALSPAKVILGSDATIGIDYLPNILDISGKAIDFFAFFICYGITVFGLYRLGFKKSLPIMISYSAATFMKYALNILSSRLIYHTAQERLSDDIKASLVSFSVELLQYFIVIAVSQSMIGRFRKLAAVATKNAEKLGDGKLFDARGKVFPYEKLVSFSNPVLRAAFFSAIVVSSFLVLQRLIYDFTIGFPTGVADALWMVAGYASDIAAGVLGYLVMIFVGLRCDASDMKLRERV